MATKRSLAAVCFLSFCVCGLSLLYILSAWNFDTRLVILSEPTAKTLHSYPNFTQIQNKTTTIATTVTAPSDLMIVSYMRSGSTFTGRMLGFRNDTFYFFEPLWKLSAWGYFKGSRKICVQDNIHCQNPYSLEDVYHILEGTYNCNISRALIQRYVERKHMDLSGPRWNKMCSNGPMIQCTEALRDMCLTSKHRVTKILRMTTDLSHRVLQKFPKLKMIYLVRDPRGIMYSRVTTGWFDVLTSKSSDADFRHAAKGLCDKMRYDTQGMTRLLSDFPDRVKIVQYEDILLNPETAKPCIFSFIGMDLTQEDEGIQKNAFKWMTLLLWKHVKIIDEECNDVIETFGYMKFKNEAEFQLASTMSTPVKFLYQCRDT